jgi:RNA polymerase sigma factor (sigma-70 family)
LTGQSSHNPIEYLLRDLTPRVLGAVTRRFRDFAAAEDAVQEALLAAALQWPREGVPDNPRGWLIQVASRRMTDYLRSEEARRRRESEVAIESGQMVPAAEVEPETDQDDTLTLFFMCCHPSLTRSSAIALTLRAVGGLTTSEIAHAFLVPEATMAQRISRAKSSIKASGVPFQLPTSRERAQRLRTVLHVLYLIFNEGYTSSAGPHVQRLELSREAIRLTRSVHTLLPDDGEVVGLLALMLLTDARRAARTGPDEELIPLTKQDRTLWDQAEISEGLALLTAALPKGSIGPYQLQAAIAAVHDEAVRAEDTDWPQILALYELLKGMSDNPMVALNHAIAAAMVHGPSKGLELLRTLDSDARLAGHHRLDAVRAHLLEMAGDHQAAITHYRIAAGRTTSIPEQNYLMTQVARLSESTPSPDRAIPRTDQPGEESLNKKRVLPTEQTAALPSGDVAKV